MLQITPHNSSSEPEQWQLCEGDESAIREIIQKKTISNQKGMRIRHLTPQGVSWDISCHSSDILKCLPIKVSPKKLLLPTALKVFYFVNTTINPYKYKEILKAHLIYIKQSGASIANNFSLTIVCAASSEDIKIIANLAKEILPHLFNIEQANITPSRFKLIAIPHSVYERDCLDLIWKDALACNSEAIYCYAHAKGVSSLPHGTEGRKITEAIFSSLILKRLWGCAHLMTTFPNLNKVAGCFSPEGFAWHNFWLAKASYIKKIAQPAISLNRYYYEYWLSGIEPNDQKIASGEIQHESSQQYNQSCNTNTSDCVSLIATKSNFNLGGNLTKKQLEQFILQNHQKFRYEAFSGLWPIKCS